MALEASASTESTIRPLSSLTALQKNRQTETTLVSSKSPFEE